MPHDFNGVSLAEVNDEICFRQALFVNWHWMDSKKAGLLEGQLDLEQRRQIIRSTSFAIWKLFKLRLLS